MTTGEGGMVTTDDDEIAAGMKRMRLHGIDRSIWDRFTKTNSKWEYDVIAAGYKYNLPDVTAAIGLAQLERAREFRDARAPSCRAVSRAPFKRRWSAHRFVESTPTRPCMASLHHPS